MQNREKLLFPVGQFVGPGIGSKRAAAAASQVENRDANVPDRMIALFLMHRHALDKGRLTAVLGFHRLFERVMSFGCQCLPCGLVSCTAWTIMLAV